MFAARTDTASSADRGSRLTNIPTPHRETGATLSPVLRQHFEPKFQFDFSRVRVHASSEAARSADRLRSSAYTVGNDIVFGTGQYDPQSDRGRGLVAHELAHVVQQSRSTEQEQDRIDARSDSQAEADARQAAMSSFSEARVRIRESRSPRIACQPVDAAAPQPKRPAVRVDYPADEHAYPGMELAYTAEGSYPTEHITAPGVYRAKFYWLAPHLRSGTENVVYYVAYNPEIKRNEYVIGPSQIQNFLAHQDLFRYNAAAAYPLRGEPPEYQAQSVRVATRAAAGDYSGAWKAWKASWVAASKDPQFIVSAGMATAGALAGPAAAVESKAAAGAEGAIAEGSSVSKVAPPEPIGPPAPAAKPVSSEPFGPPPPPKPVTATPKPATGASSAGAAAKSGAGAAAKTSEEVFAELDKELQGVKEGPGELKGTSKGGFESPKPLTSSGGKPTAGGPALRESAGASTKPPGFQSASAQTSRSLKTAIRADVGEAEAYKAALKKGEIGLQRPEGANAAGTDFITAVDGPDGARIIVTDVKNSTTGRFPAPKGPGVKPSWQAEVHDAVKSGRLNLGDPALEARIQQAAAEGKITVRQVNVDYSPQGGGRISGL